MVFTQLVMLASLLSPLWCFRGIWQIDGMGYFISRGLLVCTRWSIWCYDKKSGCRWQLPLLQMCGLWCWVISWMSLFCCRKSNTDFWLPFKTTLLKETLSLLWHLVFCEVIILDQNFQLWHLVLWSPNWELKARLCVSMCEMNVISVWNNVRSLCLRILICSVMLREAACTTAHSSEEWARFALPPVSHDIMWCAHHLKGRKA